ncbi:MULTISPECIES: LysR family transcriptional regulator [unclassified Pseudomonas]|uniref:LysR family transcriptional regulator n=1 Tax=unclassified Pseudomonas TaxID=196821 RepID=UPI002AC98CDD|nr:MULTISPECIES: LysR family transcriptional regulator [unclassified Pseudomonas]MEB0040885.1 LysR family transcriptional regulator [Pseudomonas sp. MH10]MEB0079569.1 LysR family transcriptional regulator [Pseudomonas sp. MH10out]MEB0090187.1 LysR family transcriptional regulator [Pseudomonas sp. CCI4.2]MEB0102666.1 LysR family transcriptional regulator [Pseudomonas sp. CCI3.2]MEB0119448.1 LysR family transcriptional regulator [Pseudomonas sp. CCI1.2]
MQKAEIEGLWTHVYWLSVLAEQGTYTAAAIRLGVSKSAVSQRIVELEKVMGMSLVQRTTRSVRLTDAGLALVRDVGGAYEQIARSFSEVRDSAGVARGLLRLTAPVAFARQQLVPHLAEFLAELPEVRVQLDVSDHISSIASEGYDLAIRHSHQIPDTHVAWKLCATHSVLVATQAYLERFGNPQHPEDLLRHNCLYYPRGADVPAWTFEAPVRKQAERNRLTVPITGSFATNNSEALRDAALTHLGIALLPDFSAQAGLIDGRLIQVLPKWKLTGAFPEEINLVRPYSAQVPKAVSAFVGYLKARFSAGFGWAK